MAAACQDDHAAVRVLLQVLVDGFRHGLVPQDLRLVKEVEAPVVRAFVLAEDLPEPAAIVVVGEIHLLRQCLLLVVGEGVHAAFRDLFDDLAGEVQGDDRDLFNARKIEDRFVQVVVEAPSLEVFRPLQELALLDGSAQVVVQGFLERPLEHLHADGELRVFLVEAFDDLELHIVVREAVVIFPHIDDLFPCCAVDHRAHRLEQRQVDDQGLLSQFHHDPPFGAGCLRGYGLVEQDRARCSVAGQFLCCCGSGAARPRLDQERRLVTVQGILFHHDGDVGGHCFHPPEEPADDGVVAPEQHQRRLPEVFVSEALRFPLFGALLLEQFAQVRVYLRLGDWQHHEGALIAQERCEQ